jgi:hypothetical protein
MCYVATIRLPAARPAQLLKTLVRSPDAAVVLHLETRLPECRGSGSRRSQNCSMNSVPFFIGGQFPERGALSVVDDVDYVPRSASAAA